MLFRISSYSQQFTGSSVFSQTTGCWRKKTLESPAENLFREVDNQWFWNVTDLLLTSVCFEGLVKLSVRFMEWKIIPPNESLFLVPGDVVQVSGRLGSPVCLDWFSPKIFTAASKPRNSGQHRDQNLYIDQNLHRD